MPRLAVGVPGARARLPKSVPAGRATAGRAGRSGRAVHRVLAVRYYAEVLISANIKPVEYRLVNRVPGQMGAARYLIGISGERHPALVTKVGDQIGLEFPDLSHGRLRGQRDRNVIVFPPVPSSRAAAAWLTCRPSCASISATVAGPQ